MEEQGNANGRHNQPEEFPLEDFPTVPTPLNLEDLKKGRTSTEDRSKQEKPEEYTQEDFPRSLSPVPLNFGDSTRRRRSAGEEFPRDETLPTPAQTKWLHHEDQHDLCTESNDSQTKVIVHGDTKDGALGHMPPSLVPARSPDLATKVPVTQSQQEASEPKLPAPGAVWVYPSGSRQDTTDVDLHVAVEHDGLERSDDGTARNLLSFEARLPFAAVDLPIVTNSLDQNNEKRNRLCFGSVCCPMLNRHGFCVPPIVVFIIIIVAAIIAISVRVYLEFL